MLGQGTPDARPCVPEPWQPPTGQRRQRRALDLRVQPPGGSDLGPARLLPRNQLVDADLVAAVRAARPQIYANHPRGTVQVFVNDGHNQHVLRDRLSRRLLARGPASGQCGSVRCGTAGDIVSMVGSGLSSPLSARAVGPFVVARIGVRPLATGTRVFVCRLVTGLDRPTVAVGHGEGSPEGTCR
jgi:hypothetical protein